MKLQVFAEILGREVLVGCIEGASYREAVFQYTEDYLKSGSGAVSISLPLQEEAFSAMQTRNFFEGLLPEGFSRRAVSRWIKTEEEDYLTILSVLGQECIGALRLTEQGTEEPAGSYELLTSEQVRSLAEEGASRSTRLLVESRLSLAGASGKVGLYFDRENGQWYLPKGKAPSTHIVKQSHVRLEKIVLNEQLCLMTARQMGLEVPDSFIINIGSGAALRGLPGSCAYSASKAAVVAFTQALGDEVRKIERNIRINAICPGPVDTEMFQQSERREFILAAGGDVSTVEELGHAAVYLASDLSGVMNSQVLVLRGFNRW